VQHFVQLGTVECHPDGECFELSKKKVYRLDRGYLKVVQINAEGMTRVKYIIVAGDLFGSLSYLLNGEHSYTEYGVAIGFVQLTALPLSEVQRLVKTDLDFEKALLTAVGKRIVKMEKRFDAMVFGDSEERILNFIREYIDSYGKSDGVNIAAPNLLTHHEISTLTATSRQTVTRVFNRLRADGFIDYNTQRLTLLRDLASVQSADLIK
jgi:CRP/FNR family transcriptional regulator, cyclic AMP receptor protein